MTAEAVVRAVDADGTVRLELTQSQACRGCEAVCLWRRLPARAAVPPPDGLRLDPGMAVSVSVSGNRILSSALLLHGVPLAGLLGGAFAGFSATGTDPGSLAGAILGTSIALAASGGLRRRIEHATLGAITIRPLG